MFKSVFSAELQNFIDLKLAQGYDFKSQILALKRLDKYFVENELNEKSLSKEFLEKWCERKTWQKINTQCNKISILRTFTTFLSERGFQVYIPPKRITRHAPKYSAHIYTKDELRRLFSQTDQCTPVPRECPYRHLVMPIFFRMLYSSGFRLSELRLLKICNINFEEGYVVVKNAKNKKDRIVPLTPRILEMCRKLKNEIHKESSQEEFFFMKYPGIPMSMGNVYHNFRRFLDRAGITHTGDGPRIHDLRHTFCVHLLKKFIDESKDLLTYMPYMRTLLGHESFKETAYYLKLTADLYPDLRIKVEKLSQNIFNPKEIEYEEFY